MAEGSHSVGVWPQHALTGLSAASGWLSLLCHKDKAFRLQGAVSPQRPVQLLAAGPAAAFPIDKPSWELPQWEGLAPLCQSREKEGRAETGWDSSNFT